MLNRFDISTVGERARLPPFGLRLFGTGIVFCACIDRSAKNKLIIDEVSKS